uniref:MAM domain containing 4 n=1 Tax=Accipiter nisus TaxID=211598 RepID=A0A8B9NBZ6_9AVES
SPIAGTILPSGSMVVNSCRSAAEQLCNFICDCSNCSDENQCGYLRGSAVLGTPFTCDFEEGDCGWQDVSTSAYRWVRGRASLATWGTGPHSDHTVGTDLGWFMVTVYPPTKTMATAWLRSPVMQEAAATCEIRAWYHLSGKRPLLRLAMAYRDEVVGLWQSPEHGGKGWYQLVAYPGRIAERFQVRQGSVGTWASSPQAGARGASHLLTVCPTTPEPGQQVCGAEESRCRRGFCLAQHRFCDGTDDCGDRSDEDATWCSEHSWPWGGGPAHQSVEVGQPAWERNTSLNLGTAYGIPTRDHSNNSRAGTWLGIGTAEESRLSLHPHPQLVLYYHLHGSATSSLSISYVTSSTKHLVRERTGDLGSCWVRERVDFNTTESFKVGWCHAGASWPACGARGTGPLPVYNGLWSPAPWEPPGCRDLCSCLAGVDGCHCNMGGGGAWAGCWAGGAARDVGPLPQPLRVFPCPGAFLALQAGEGQMVAAARARTPLLGPSGPACAMEMSYHIHSSPKGNPPVQPRGALPAPCSPPCPGTLGSLPPPCCPQVELLGLVDLQDSESAAIDNVTFVQCHLDMVPPGATALSCNFERGMCGWYQDQSSDFKWHMVTGQGQGSDHTTGLGYFMAADPTAPWSRGQRAQLVTYRQEPIATPHCLSFWYRLAGPQIGTLNLKLQMEGVEETVVWTRRGTQGSVWHQGWATLPGCLTPLSWWQVAFEALRDGFLGDMALDDLALTAGPCGAELSCSFEADACGLVASGQRTWLRQSNGTGTTAGPQADHTTGTATGHYMVVSTGRDSLPAGHAAALTSQPYQPSAPAQCLAFWYQLSARTPGFLGVFVEQSGVRRKVMGISTMEGDAWHRGHVTVRPDGDWQAIFEAVGAGGNHGYIALDDLHVSDGACPEPVSCDFEWDMCGWSSPSDPRLHSFAWGWKSGVPLAKYPSPEQDHTLGTRNGHYVHFDTSVLGPGGTTARLESQHLPATADSCLQFWYHMDIPEHLSCGELRVILHSVAGQRTVWTVVGHQSQGWRGGVVPVQSPSEFQVSEATLGCRVPSGGGTVALDDFLYSAGRGCHSSQEVPKSSGSFVPEVVLGLLLAVITLALVAAGGWYWLKRRGLASGTPAESNTPQGFDNITFQDVRTGLKGFPACPQLRQNSIFLKVQQILVGSP